MRIGLHRRYALIIALSAVAVASAVQIVSYRESIRLADIVERSSSKAMSRALRREADLAAKQLAAVLTDSLVDPLDAEDFERLLNITRSVRALPSVTEIMVYDRDGNVIHDGTKEIASYGTRAPENLRRLVLGEGQIISKFNDNALENCIPIMTQGRIIGAVRFSTSLARFESHMNWLNRELAAINQESADKHLRNFIGLIVVLIMLGIVAGFACAGRLTRPIQSLTAATRQIAQGDFSVKLPQLRPDELGELASSLKRMAGEIEESMISRSILEKEVRSRTAALEKANKQLEARDHHRRQFLAEVSHELRTPLTIIHGEAQVTSRLSNADVTRYQDSLSTINEQSATMRLLVDDLLKLARLDDHLTEYHFERVPVAELIEATDKSAQKLAKTSDLEISCESKRHDIAVHGDRQKLGQLLLIFIKNSITYSPNGGKIDIRSDADGDAAQILITDQGMGLETLDQERIFDPFYRGQKARHLFPSGSGLGLSIAQKISDAHRGEICITGGAERGTTVSIRLPLFDCGGQA